MRLRPRWLQPTGPSQGVIRRHRPQLHQTMDRDGQWRYQVTCACGWTGGEYDSQVVASGDHMDHVMQVTISESRR